MGTEPDTKNLASYSKKHGFLVAMANHNKPTGGLVPIDKSGIWESSRLIAAADETQNALVIAADSLYGWNGEVVKT